MLIAFPITLRDPLEESLVTAHFGKAQHYALYDTEKNELRVIPNESSHFGGTLSPPHFLHSKGVNVVVTKRLGGPAYEKLKAAGIEVKTPPEHVRRLKEALETKDQWINVTESSPVMDHHDHHHDHHHEHGHGHHH